MIDLTDTRPKTYRIDSKDIEKGIARLYVRYSDEPEDTEVEITIDTEGRPSLAN